jgi:hypothetical protein
MLHQPPQFIQIMSTPAEISADEEVVTRASYEVVRRVAHVDAMACKMTIARIRGVVPVSAIFPASHLTSRALSVIL